MQVKVKICGLTNSEDAKNALEFGADLLGLIFVPGTPRYIDREKAREIVDNASQKDKKSDFVPLFRDEDLEKVVDIMGGIGSGYVQLHGEESPEYVKALKRLTRERVERDIKVIKTFKIKGDIQDIGGYNTGDYHDADYLLFDTYDPILPGGTGEGFDLDILVRKRASLKKPFFVAGGLEPDNVGEVVRIVKPYGVDVVSGTEAAPGKKDRNKLREFIQNAKEA